MLWKRAKTDDSKPFRTTGEKDRLKRLERVTPGTFAATSGIVAAAGMMDYSELFVGVEQRRSETIIRSDATETAGLFWRSIPNGPVEAAREESHVFAFAKLL